MWTFSGFFGLWTKQDIWGQHFYFSLLPGGSGSRQGPGRAQLLGASGWSSTAAGSPPGCGNVLPEDQKLWQAHLPLPHHRQPGQAAQDDEDRWEILFIKWFFIVPKMRWRFECLVFEWTNICALFVCSWDQEGHEWSLSGCTLPGRRQWEGPHPEELWTEWVHVSPSSHIHSSFLYFALSTRGFVNPLFSIIF